MMLDILRLVAVPVFAWAAYQDLRTRRVSAAIWPPLAAIGIVALLAEAVLAWSVGGAAWVASLIPTALSVGLGGALAALLWWAGAGMADVKAVAVLAVLFPMPLATSGALALWPASLSIVTTAVLVALALPVALALSNARAGRLRAAMVIGHPVPVERVPETHGSLLETAAGRDLGGVDCDTVAAYLRWRECSLEELSTAAVRADGGGDPWQAEAFCDDRPGEIYGATPAELRGALEALVETETVWIAPGLPFLVPLFVGLVVTVALLV